MKAIPLGWLSKLRALAGRLKHSIIQECPPENYACEICGHLDCGSEQWRTCRKRLAAAQFVKSGNLQALAELKQLRAEQDRAVVESRQACSGTVKCQSDQCRGGAIESSESVE
jgi:hypothetical protein